MKVLIVQKMGGISGSEYYFMKLLPGLRKYGIDAQFACVQHPANAAKNAPFFAHFEKENVPCHVFTSNSSFSLAILFWLKNLIKEKEFKILHTNLLHADIWGAAIKGFLYKGFKLISTKHGYGKGTQKVFTSDAVVNKDAFYYGSKFVARYLDAAIVVSNWLYKRLITARLIDPASSKVIHLGFDFDEVKETSATGTLRFASRQAIIVGRLIPYKQHKLLLDAWAKVVRGLPDSALVIVGSGLLENELKEYAEGLNISKQVYFEGFRTNVHNYLADSDVSVISSSAEGFGIVILEAWLHHLPVVAFDVPAPNELIDNGKNGLLVEPYSVAKLAEALLALLSDVGYSKSLGSHGYNTLRSRNNFDSMASATIQLYRQVLQS